MSNKFCPDCNNPVTVRTNSQPYEVTGVCSTCGWTGPIKDSLLEIPSPSFEIPYLSIDLETTGLDAETCQTLEIGAVMEDWKIPVDELPVYHRYVVYPLIVGTPYALALNAEILRKIACQNDHPLYFLTPEEVVDDLLKWLLAVCHWDATKESMNAAGKNFSSFDLTFLRKLPGWDRIKFSHRALDPAILYLLPTDKKLPDTKTCLKRAGLVDTITHHAVDDAKQIIHLVRHGVRRLK